MRPEGGMKGFVWSISNLFPIRTLLSHGFGSLYAEALAHPRISGLVIGTRPDCVDDEKPGFAGGAWHGNAMWRSNTASNPPATKHCGPSVAAMTSRRPGRLLRRAPHGVARRGPFHSGAARRRRRNASSTGGADQCPAARNGQVPPVAGSFGERPLPRNTTPSPAASACVPPRSISRWWSRCCGGCVPIWLWSVSPAKCRWDFTT